MVKGVAKKKWKGGGGMKGSTLNVYDRRRGEKRIKSKQT